MYNIAILTTTYNCEDYIKNLNKLIAKNKSKKEYIKWYVSDNCSNDKTIEIIKKNADKILIKNDNGIYDALNSMIINKELDFEYYIVFGSDDLILDNINNILIEEIKNNNKSDIILFPVIESGTRKIKTPKYNGKNYKLSHHSCGMLIKRNLHFKYALYDSKFKICADEKFFREMEKNKDVIISIANNPIGIYNTNGISSNITRKIIKENFLIEFFISKKYFLSIIKYLFRLIKFYAN